LEEIKYVDLRIQTEGADSQTDGQYEKEELCLHYEYACRLILSHFPVKYLHKPQFIT